MTKERKGIKHFKHACRNFETSEEEDRIREFIDLVLSGVIRSQAAKQSNVGISTARRYIMPTKEMWDSLPEKGTGSKYTYIKMMKTFSNAKNDKKRVGDIMSFLVQSYIGNEYNEIKRKADKFDALIALIR